MHLVSLDRLAADLGVSIDEIHQCLRDLRLRRPRAGILSSDLAEQVRVQLPITQERWKKRQAALEARVTTTEAAAKLRIPPSTLRQWTSRGYLQPVGKLGRQNLYRVGDLNQVWWEVHERTRRTPSNVREEPEHLDKLVPTYIAAKIAKVSPSTIRMWVHRGHLTPVGRHRRRLVFVIRDVIDAANRAT